MVELSSNELTLRAYERKLPEYTAGTPQTVDGGLQKFLDGAFADLPRGSTVLELGAGFGRDALYLQAKGFAVIPTDAADSFVAELKRRGLPAYRLNVLEDPFPGVDAIFANAVFLHLSREELSRVLAKARSALRAAGKLIFTMKEGQGEEWSAEKLGEARYFCYWRDDELTVALIEAGFSTIQIAAETVGKVKWLHVVAS